MKTETKIETSRLPHPLRDPVTGRSGGTLSALEKDGAGRVRDGFVTFDGSERWYRFENYVLDLLPESLRDRARWERFASKYGLPRTWQTPAAGPEMKGQREQIDFFRDDSKVYDRDVSDLPFYRASDAECLDRWVEKITGTGEKLVLDIGGGTGRQVLPLTRAGHRVLSFDISEEMLEVAVKKTVEHGLLDRVFFFLGDATNIPLDDSCVDAAIAYGVLHHVPSPRTTVCEAGRVLKDGGSWYSYDPHDSSMRFVFEIAMKIKELYAEEANEAPLVPREGLRNWCREAGIDAELRFHTYVLPHFLAPFSRSAGAAILRFTDAVGAVVPFIKHTGGIIISDGVRSRAR